MQAFRGRGPDRGVQRRLAVAAGARDCVGALSWLVLAYGHMLFHLHIDAIVFYLPFLPLVFAMIAVRLQTVSLRAWPRQIRSRGGAASRSAAVQSAATRPVLADVVGGSVDRA